ncbi:MAG: hypothetical protein ACOC7P_00365 [Chloroflexota bacterium]
MQVEKKSSVLCPHGHENLEGTDQCEICGLPVIACKQEIDALLESFLNKVPYIVPRVHGCFIGVGTKGNELIDLFYRTYSGSSEEELSFFNIDAKISPSVVSSERAIASNYRNYSIAQSDTGGFIYCGLAEKAASQDTQLNSYLVHSGVREKDSSQAIFVTTAIGGATGSGIAPVVNNYSRTQNPEVSTVAIAIVPSEDEADSVHLNAFYAISRLLTLESNPNTDLILLLSYDRLKRVKGIGIHGEELVLEQMIGYLLNLLRLDLSQLGIGQIARMSKGLMIQVFVPCLAIGRSMKIFGNVTNVLDSALAYPLGEINPASVMVSYLILRRPGGVAKEYPDELIINEFDKWNRKHFPALRASMAHIVDSEDHSDRVDACVLLGGDKVSVTMEATEKSYRRFKSYLKQSVQWEQYGLSEEKLDEAERVVRSYDNTMDSLKVSEAEN